MRSPISTGKMVVQYKSGISYICNYLRQQYRVWLAPADEPVVVTGQGEQG
jgi:hypothetical protein